MRGTNGESGRVLVVDDRAGVRRALVGELLDLGHHAVEARDGLEALAIVGRSRIDLVLSDVRMPRLDGIGLARELANRPPPLVLFSAAGDVPTAVAAMRAGATDFVPLPAAPPGLARRAVRHLRISPGPSIEGPLLAGEHPIMVALRERLARIARHDVPVLITGETGSGKEVAAREIHRSGPRRRGPFVALNCCAVPEGLLESELFGHERGAFTGATTRHAGLFERADGGCLFLDEIGDAAPSIQAKLLRVLERGEFDRLGGSGPVRVDVRVIAATHRDLSDLLRRGLFRHDLYHRLNVVPVSVPPLRERSSDIPSLIRLISRGSDLRLRFTPAALDVLGCHGWPGNVRELRNVLERLSVICESDGRVTVERARAAIDGDAAPATARSRFELDERERLRRLLVEQRFNVSATARAMGTSRGALRHRLRRYGLA